MEFSLSPNWQTSGTQAVMGVLAVRGLSNPMPGGEFDKLRAELELELRRRYAGFDRAALKALPAIKAYDEFYKRFKKTYHLLLQLESILEGRPIPSGDALVSAMFMAELEDLLLTAGHDLERIRGLVQFDVAQGAERYERMNGESQQLKAGDLYSADEAGVLSSVIYGPDRRTRITPTTTSALFTTYGVPGIDREQVQIHLKRLHDFIVILSPGAELLQLAILGRSQGRSSGGSCVARAF
jgi:DNA/RNA-binding domain of Phe-tRNA-synthetase-like protein